MKNKQNHRFTRRKNIVKKTLSFLLAVCLGVSVLSTAVFADDLEFGMFYDFEGYGGGAPDENWRTHNGSSGVNKMMGKTENGNGYATMAFYSYAGLFFNRIADSGILHISYDAKVSTNRLNFEQTFMTGMSDGLYNSGFGTANYSRGVTVNGNTGAVTYRRNESTGTIGDRGAATVTADMQGETFDFTQWHRFDIITTDLSKSDATIAYYIDGVPVLDSPLGVSNTKGIKGLWFYITHNPELGDCYDNRDYMMIDNLSVERYYDEAGLRGTVEGSGKVAISGGELTVRLSERVNPDLLTPGNITISGGLSDKRVTDFTVEPINDTFGDLYDGTVQKFKIHFNGELEMGHYSLSLGSSVTGTSLKKKMVTPVSFRTDSKTVNVDGSDVVIPEIENIKYLAADGNEIRLSDSVTSTMHKIEISFNTLVDADSVRDKISVTADNGDVEYTIDVADEENSGNLYSVATVTFPKLLEVDSSYTMNIAEGIKSGVNTAVESPVTESQTINTKNDPVFTVTQNELVHNGGDSWTYKLSVIKKTEDEISLTALAGLYSGGDVKKLEAVAAVPLEFTADEGGLITREISLTAPADATPKTTIWKWNGNQKLELSGGATGNVTVK